jgi:hypothetical protein
MENTVIISDHTQMDRTIKEERQYILNIIKQIEKTNCKFRSFSTGYVRYSRSCRRNFRWFR